MNILEYTLRKTPMLRGDDYNIPSTMQVPCHTVRTIVTQERYIVLLTVTALTAYRALTMPRTAQSKRFVLLDEISHSWIRSP